MYSGYAWPHSDMMASCYLRGHPHCTEKCFLESLHASQGPHFCVEIGSLNFLLTDTWLSDSLCTHVTIYALSVCPCEQHCCFWISRSTNDQMGMLMETLLGSSRRYVPKGLSRGMGTGRRRPELHSRRREQEQPQVTLGLQNYGI